MLDKNRSYHQTETDVAIIGMSCRFPGGANTPEDFWRIVCGGIDATSRVPEDRWSRKKFWDPDPDAPGKTYVDRGGFITEKIDRFDARFFNISPREALHLDPQQKLLMELTWEALEDAGIIPEHVRGSRTGVFIGGFTMDNKIHLLNTYNRENIAAHTAISSTGCMLSNRLSYTFDLNGPSMTVDTACSSSAVAIHLACRELLSGTCSLAVSGGVNIILRPEYTIAMSKGGFLSPSGRCKTFDAEGDGYARGEGAGLLILKRLDNAVKDGEEIYAVISGSGINQDGRSNSITAPRAEAQMQLIRDVYDRAGIRPDQVQYVEAHGTGTRVGDRTEALSIGKGLAGHRNGLPPLLVGSVKTNIGHTEAAAGVAAVIKTALALKQRHIPPNLNFNTPNPEIDFDALGLKVPTEPAAWPDHEGPAYAGINAFGYGGTNAHIILSEAKPPRRVMTPPRERRLLFPVTAASEESLIARIRQLSDRLETRPGLVLEDVGYTLAKTQTHFDHRYTFSASDMPELRQSLSAFNRKADAYPRDYNGARRARPDTKLAFVYTGMGPQFLGMGIQLLNENKTAASIFEQCDRIWKPLAGWSLETLFTDDSGLPMSGPAQAQPANFVLQLMVTAVLRSYGISPDGTIGHSVGEIASAHIAGSLNLRDALTISFHRSRLQNRIAGKGKMLAAGISPAEAELRLNDLKDNLSVAAVNARHSVTFAGDKDAIDRLSGQLTDRHIFNRILKTDVAYHSHHVTPLMAEFSSCIKNSRYKVPKLPLYSTVSGRRITSPQTSDYWNRNMRQTVLFSQALDGMIQDGFNRFIEIGPHTVLAGSIRDALFRTGTEGETVAALKRGEADIPHICSSIGELFNSGADLDWTTLYPDGNRIKIGPYPWSKQVLWQETEASKTDRLGTVGHPFISLNPDDPQSRWEGELSTQFHPFLPDHRIRGEIIFPGSGYIEMALVAREVTGDALVLEDFQFHRPLAVAETPVLKMVLDSNRDRLSIYSRPAKSGSAWISHAGCRLVRMAPPADAGPCHLSPVRNRCRTPVDVDDFYASLAELGLEYGSDFRCIRKGSISRTEVLTELVLPETLRDENPHYYLHPVLLDSAFQSLMATRLPELLHRRTLFLPSAARQVRYYRQPGHGNFCHGRIRRATTELIQADLSLFDDSGNRIMDVLGFEARAIKVVDASDSRGAVPQYEMAWSRIPLKTGRSALPSRWLVFCDNHGIGTQLSDLGGQEFSCIRVMPGDGYRKPAPSLFQIRRNNPADMRSLFREIHGEALDGIVYLWGLNITNITADDGSSNGPNPCGSRDLVDLTHMIQHLSGRPGSAAMKICIGLCRAQYIPGFGDCRNPGQNALVGFGRVLGLEYPDLQIKIVDLNSMLPFKAGQDLYHEISIFDRETEIAVRNGIRFVNRIVKDREEIENTRPDESTNFTLTGNDTFVETYREIPGKGEVEIRVLAASPGNLSHPGTPGAKSVRFFTAGRITRIGPGVKGLAPGLSVMVLEKTAALQSYITIRAASVLPVPEEMPPAHIVALPDWICAYHALFKAGNIKPGDSILIHQATSGFGPAALVLARRSNARIYATDWSGEKRENLRTMGAEKVWDSGSLTFADEAGALAGDAGIDLVIGPAGDLMNQSVDILADGGKLVFGQGDLSASGLPVLKPGRALRMHRVDTDAIFGDDPSVPATAISGLEKRFGRDIFSALASHTISINRISRISKMLSRKSGHRSVVVDFTGGPVSLKQRLPINLVKPDAAYIVTGGFGGLGLATLEWLVEQNARCIVVLSRSGLPTPEVRKQVAELASRDVRILSRAVDIGDGNALQRVFQKLVQELPPVKGVIHSAAVMEDTEINDLRAGQIHRVMNAKALGAWNLHQILDKIPLDFFISYSSMTSMLGNIGQAAYAAANAFLDGLMQFRRSCGLPGMSINWGVIADVGMVARETRTREYLKKLGITGLSPRKGLAQMAKALAEGRRQLGIFNLDWQRWQHHQEKPNPRMRELVSSPSDRSETWGTFRNQILGLPPQDRLPGVVNTVTKMISSVLKLPCSGIDKDDLLTELGIDSLTATELAARIRGDCGVGFRALYLLRGPKIVDMCGLIVEEVNSENPETSVAVR